MPIMYCWGHLDRRESVKRVNGSRVLIGMTCCQYLRCLFKVSSVYQSI